MLHSISWTNYLFGVLLLTLSYYLLIVIQYYSQDIKNWFSRDTKSKNQSMSSAIASNERVENQRQFGEAQALISTSEDSFQQAEELISWITEVLNDAAQKKYTKAELQSSLSAILTNYKELKSTAIQSAINELILTEFKKSGLVTLSEDEIEKLWNEGV